MACVLPFTPKLTRQKIHSGMMQGLLWQEIRLDDGDDDRKSGHSKLHTTASLATLPD